MSRTAYIHEGDDHIDDEYIKMIAKRCARCSRDFGCSYCTNCQFNPAQFVEFNRARMMRTAYQVSLHEVAENIKPSIGVQILKFIGIIVGIVIALAALVNKDNKPAHTYNSYTYKTNNKVSKTNNKTSLIEVEKEVQKVLYKVRDNIKDLNYDGAVNCQDYCLLFIQYYPTAQIVYNKFIGDSGHVFIRVHTDDGWLYIEPQNTSNFYARDAWYKNIYPKIKEHNVVVPKEWIQ